MKKLLASCAVVALMAAPAYAQSTVDPQAPDIIPVEPEVSEPIDPTLIEPETDVLPDELPADPTLAEETSPPVPEGEAVDQAETWDESEAFAESEPMVTAAVAPPGGILEAQIDEADLPDEYSTDDLNAVMLAQVNEVSTEIASMDAETDVWVSEGSDAGSLYVPEGQGDVETLPEETFPEGDEFTAPEEDTFIAPEEDAFVVPEEDAYVTPESQAPETEMEPQFGVETDDMVTDEAPADTEY